MCILVIVSVMFIVFKSLYFCYSLFFFSSRRRHTRCALVTGAQTCALPISVASRIPHAAHGLVHTAAAADLEGTDNRRLRVRPRVRQVAAHREEIGRASCRERVCQYV